MGLHKSSGKGEYQCMSCPQMGIDSTAALAERHRLPIQNARDHVETQVGRYRGFFVGLSLMTGTVPLPRVLPIHVNLDGYQYSMLQMRPPTRTACSHDDNTVDVSTYEWLVPFEFVAEVCFLLTHRTFVKEEILDVAFLAKDV